MGDVIGFPSRLRLLRSSAADHDDPGKRLRVVKTAHPSPELLETLESYESEAFGATGLRRYDLAVMAKAGRVLLAYLDDEIVGGCQLMRMLDEPDMFYVVGFYVREEWRGRRLGRTFLLEVAQEAQAAGAEGLVLTVSPENRSALELYRSMGFVDEEFAAGFYGEGEDRQVLRWRFGGGNLPGSV